MNEKNPINEASIEHGLHYCYKLRETGKTLDDLIDHLEKTLTIIKVKKFKRIEEELTV